jgi:cytochrome P450
MRSIFYHLMKSPEVYAELIKEIDDATASGQLSSPPTFREASELPFLCATIKEAMRLHPSVGLTMPRVTPAGGLEVAGTHIPAGYSIGMNAAVVGYSEDVYGPDAHAFQPKRWLGENASAMNKHNLIFGAGTRTCIGKNVRRVPMRCQRQLHSLTCAVPSCRYPSVRYTSLFS